MRKFMLSLAIAAMAVPATAPALADPGKHGDHGDRGDRGGKDGGAGVDRRAQEPREDSIDPGAVRSAPSAIRLGVASLDAASDPH